MSDAKYVLSVIIYIVLIPIRFIISLVVLFKALDMTYDYPELSYLEHCKEGLTAVWFNRLT